MATLDEKMGGLLEAMRRVQADVTDIKRTAQDNNERAEQWRDAVSNRLTKLENEAGDVQSDVAAIKVVTDTVTRWQWMGIGALAVTGLASGVVGAFLAAYWQKFLTAIP